MMAAPAPFLAPGALAPAGSGTRDPLPRRADHRARLSPRPARGNSGDRRPGRVSIVPRAASDANGAPDDPDPSGATLESEFMRVMREQNARVRQATATRWKQGGLRPRVVHESDSDYIRRVDFQWPNAVMGTASGAVLVSNCEELGGSEYRERARRLVAARRDAHGRDWQAADDRGLGERSLLGLYDGGAITAVAIADDVVASGGRDGYRRAWRLPTDADVDSPSHPSEGLPLELVGEAKHPNVVTSIAMDPTTGTAWTTCLDGCLRRWEYARGAARAGSKPGGAEGDRSSDSDSASRAPRLRLAGEWSTGQPALCAALCAWERVVYVGTAGGLAFAFDAGAPCGVDDRESCDAPASETRGALCRWLAHDNGATRSVAACPGGCVTGSSAGPIMAWKWNTTPSAAAAANVEANGVRSTMEPPRAVSKLLGHVAAVVALSAGNPAHLVSGAHDGTVRVWDMPKLSDAPGAAGVAPGVDLAGVIDDLLRSGEEEDDEKDDATTRADASSDGTRGDGDGDSTEAKAEAEAPKIERREALYAVTGHTVWLGGISADDTRILCDGANNIALMYDYSEDPVGAGDV